MSFTDMNPELWGASRAAWAPTRVPPTAEDIEIVRFMNTHGLGGARYDTGRVLYSKMETGKHHVATAVKRKIRSAHRPVAVKPSYKSATARGWSSTPYHERSEHVY